MSKNILIFIGCLFFLFTTKLNGQCNITSNPQCLLINQPISFNTTNPQVTHWRVKDISGNIVFPHQASPNFTFNSSGKYIIEPGFVLGFTFYQIIIGTPSNPINCEKIITVGENQPIINLNQSSITVCSGSWINLGQEINSILHVEGPASYSMITSNGDVYNSFSDSIFLTTETSVTFKINDVTGCIAEETININYTQNPSTTNLFNLPNLNCAGESFTLSANNPNSNYTYSWFINNELIQGQSITTNLTNTTNTAQNFDIILYIDDNTSCPTYNIQTITVPPTPFINLDTLVSNWNSEANAFTGCAPTSPYLLTLNTNTNSATNIDSLVTIWKSFDPNTNTTSYDTIIYNNPPYLSITNSINENTSSVQLITFSTLNNTQCSNQLSYNILYNTSVPTGVSGDFAKICGSQCIGTSIPFTMAPSQVNFPQNAKMRFIIRCTDYEADTIFWTYQDFLNSQDSIDISTCPDPPEIRWRAIFRYTFPKSSCDCDNLNQGYYLIRTHIITACDTTPNGDQSIKIDPDPNPSFNIPSQICENSTISISNDTYFGCTPSSNSPFSASDTVFFAYNFGDSCSKTIYDTVTTMSNFPNISHTYKAGKYEILLITSKNSCSTDTTIANINVYPKPIVSFTADPVCYGLPTELNGIVTNQPLRYDTIFCLDNNSLIIDTQIVEVPSGSSSFTYLWTGMDQNNQTSQTNDDGVFTVGDSSFVDPKFIFDTCGTHIVTLKVTDGNSCIEYYTDSIIVNSLPKAGFELSQVCEGVSTEFTDTSSYSNTCSGSPIVNWQWKFGDGSPDSTYTSFIPSFTHLYSLNCNSNDTAKTFPVELVVTDANGCESSPIERDTAIVYCEPKADFDSSGICIGLPNNGQTTFNNLSSPQFGMSFDWDFGDGSTSQDANPSHTYSSSGPYLVTLKLSGNNCKDSVSYLLEVWDNPNISIFGTDIDCYGDSTGSINTFVSGGTSPYTWGWSNLDSIQNLTNLPADNYFVTLLDANNCLDTNSISLIQAEEIVSNASVSDVSCFGYSDGVAIINTSGGTGFLNIIWTNNVNPNFLSAGTYYYNVIDVNGCQINDSIIINQPNQITVTTTTTDVSCFGGNDGTANLTINGGTGSYSVNWIGNLDPNNLPAGTHNFIVNDANNCQQPGSVTINQPSTITTIIDSTVCGSLNWFGVVYNNSGTYCQTDQNNNGCDSTTCINLTVLPSLITNINPSTQSLCQNSTPNNIQIIAFGGSNTLGYTYQWYSNSTNSNTGGTPVPSGGNNNSYTPSTLSAGTTYYYCVVQQDNAGCIDTSLTVEVIITLGPSFDTQPQDIQACEGATINPLTVSYINGTGIAQYQWFSNTTNTNTGGTPVGTNSNSYTPISSPAGTTYYYCEIIFIGSGCDPITSNTAQVIIHPDPSINLNPTPYQNVCVGGTITTPLTIGFTNGVGIPTYQWYENTNNSNIGGTIIPGETNASFTPSIFTATGNYYYYCEVSLSGNGCDNIKSDVAHIEVFDDPTITNPLATQEICQNATPTTLTVSASGGIPSLTYTYQWYSNSTNSNTGGTPVPSGGNNNSYTPSTLSAGTTYYYCEVQQDNANTGCEGVSNTAEVIVTLGPSFDTQPQDIQACEGATINPLTVSYINGTGIAQYQWFSNTTNTNTGGTPVGTNSNSYTPISSPAGTTYYYCEITLTGGGGCGQITSNTAQVIIHPDPSINLNPTPYQNVCVGGTITNPLTIGFTNGVGIPAYQWYENTTNSNIGGTIIPGETNASFTPSIFTATGNYYYYCEVSLSGNGCDNIKSDVAHIEVFDDPTITNPLATQEICQNATPTTLTVSASGGIPSLTYTYQWYSNSTNSNTGGTPVPSGGNNNSYTPSTLSAGTTYYYCVVQQDNANTGCEGVSNTAEVIVTLGPSFDTQPQDIQACEGATINPLTVSYINGTGIAQYQWFSNTTNTNTGGTPVGTNSNSYTPISSPAGTTYYYCEITLTGGGGCGQITSNTAQVIIHPDPSINLNPTPSQNVCVGGTITNPLTIGFTNGVGIPTYQWYENTTNSNIGGTIIPGETNASFTPSIFTATGNYYYYCEVSLSGNGCDNIKSDVAHIEVFDDPTITNPLATQEICQNATPTTLTVSASGGIPSLTYTYQWYSNSTNSNTGGTPVPSGGNNNSYTPSTLSAGTTYYYCVVQQDNANTGCEGVSNTAEVIVTLGPSFDTQPQDIQACEGATINPLTVSYINGTGIAQYQWFSNTTNTNTGGTPVGTNSNSYTPISSPAGTTYYYCEITLTGGGGCGQITSNTAQVIIHPDPSINLNPTPYQNVCVGGTITTPLTIGFTNGVGIPAYQWYENTNNSNIGGTIIPGETNASFTPSIFTATGNYYYYCEVSLSGNGCDNIKSDVAHIEVFDTPIPLFSSLDTICVNESPIYVLSNNSFGNILTYNWQIIDTSGNIIWNEIKTDNAIPLFPTVNNPVADVKYYISLTVSNNCGDSTLIDSIVIKPTPQLYFNSIYCNSSSIALAEGIPLTLEYSNIGFVNPTNTDTLIIDWGDGLPNDTVLPNCGNIPGYIGNNAVCWQELSHTYYQSGQYTICMTGLNSCGDSTYCCDITVIPNNIRSFFQITSNYNCINESTEFIELSSNGFPNSIS